MASLFVFLYNYFYKQKLALTIAVSCLFIASLLLIFNQITLVEDVSKILPLDQSIRKINKAYQNSKFSDNLIFHLSPEDTTEHNDPDALVDFADSLVKSLQALDTTKIKEIRYTLSDGAIIDLYDLFYNNIALFLEEKDYIALANRLDSSGIQKSLESVYKTLLSPAGFMMKKNVLRDPFGLATIPLQTLKDFQIDGNYTLYNSRIMTKNKQHLLFFVSPK